MQSALPACAATHEKGEAVPMDNLPVMDWIEKSLLLAALRALTGQRQVD